MENLTANPNPNPTPTLTLTLGFGSSGSDFFMENLTALLWQMAHLLMGATSSISSAPLKLNCIQIDHLYTSPENLVQILQAHYLRGATTQLYRILGSLDFMGNPIRLVVGEHTAATSCYFLLLPVAPSVFCPCLDALHTRSSKLPPSPAVSRCLPMSTTL